MQIELERFKFDQFLSKFNNGEYPYLRFGQAFFNHFQLHKLKFEEYQQPLCRLYEADGEIAQKLINELFIFN